jgi:signal transduction histidine kinase
LPSRLAKSAFFRYAAAFPPLLLALVALALQPVYRETTREIRREMRGAVDEEVEEYNERFQRAGRSGIKELMEEDIRGNLGSTAYFLLRDENGSVLAGSQPAPPQLSHEDHAWLRVIVPGSPYVFEGREAVQPDGSRVLIARRSAIERIQYRLARQLLLSGALVFAVSLLLGWAFTRLIARRLDRMRASADRIQRGDLSERLALSGSEDELDRLAAAINRMLSRIEQLMESSRHISSAIAHDMRRPVSALRIEMDELARAPGLDEESRLRAERNVARIDEMLSTFAALLRLTRIEAGAYGKRREPVALAQVTQDAVDLYQAVAEQHGRRIQAELTAISVPGDRDLLFQAVQNLIENAMTHGSGMLAVTLLAEPPYAILQVADQGRGVPASDLERVFERF